MNKIVFICEGQSERNFVERVMEDYWKNKGFQIETETVLLGEHGSSRQGGGDVTFERLSSELRYILDNSPEALITTVFDYYGRHGNDWPQSSSIDDFEESVKKKLLDKHVLSLEEAGHFIPYFMCYELESLFFTDPEKVTDVTHARRATGSLKQILQDFQGNPEAINTNSPPSKRLQDADASYGKTRHAHLIGKKIGLDKIRNVCHHFDNWLSIVERHFSVDQKLI